MQAMNFGEFYITGAPHNFKKGFFGATLNAGGFIPLTNTFSETKKFGEYVSSIMEKGGFVHFYPEQALWLQYEQSRPLKKGAFYYACVNNVPIIPIVICFKKKNLSKHKKVIVQILKPIYPDNNLPERERITKMNNDAQNAYDNAIIDFYHYNPDEYAMNKINKAE